VNDSRSEISVTDLRQLTKTALRNLGLDDQEQQIVADVLLYAQLRDNSQGLIKIVERTVLPDRDKKPIQIHDKSVCVRHIDGGGNVGMLVLKRASDIAAATAKDTGLALASTYNTRSSTGAIGYYARSIAENGLIGIVMAGSPKVMTVYGGTAPALGTNPVAIAVPSSQQPIVLDMATAATAWFAVVDAARCGEALPQGVALDATGQTTTDPNEALRGALLAFGGSKGAGLALMCEMLTGPLAGASIVGEEADNRGNFVIAINPEMLTGNESFIQRVDAMIARIKDSGADIVLPGERSNLLATQRIADNLTSIDSRLLDELRQIAG